MAAAPEEQLCLAWCGAAGTGCAGAWARGGGAGGQEGAEQEEEEEEAEQEGGRTHVCSSSVSSKP